MIDYLKQLFSDENIIQRVKEKMPDLFQLAETDSSRAGKLGMEIGSVREKIIIALLIYKFGEENVKTDISITKSEVDVALFNNRSEGKSVQLRTGQSKKRKRAYLCHGTIVLIIYQPSLKKLE